MVDSARNECGNKSDNREDWLMYDTSSRDIEARFMLTVIPQTVLALRGSDGFSRDLWRQSGVNARSSRARSCCKNRYLVTLTFAPLEWNRGSRAQTHKNSMVFVNFCPGPRHDR